jgi:hypothetical protein
MESDMCDKKSIETGRATETEAARRESDFDDCCSLLRASRVLVCKKGKFGLHAAGKLGSTGAAMVVSAGVVFVEIGGTINF